jgi:hypothetical protein
MTAHPFRTGRCRFGMLVMSSVGIVTAERLRAANAAGPRPSASRSADRIPKRTRDARAAGADLRIYLDVRTPGVCIFRRRRVCNGGDVSFIFGLTPHQPGAPSRGITPREGGAICASSRCCKSLRRAAALLSRGVRLSRVPSKFPLSDARTLTRLSIGRLLANRGPGNIGLCVHRGHRRGSYRFG